MCHSTGTEIIRATYNLYAQENWVLAQNNHKTK